MDSKKLAKLIQIIVEAEVAKKQEHFLTKIFPKILEEEVNAKMVKLLKETKSKTPIQTTTKTKELDPFALAESVLQKERQQTQNKPTKEFTKNPVLNEILNQTQPFSSAQRSGLGGGTSILDTYQQPIQEAASYVPSYMDAEPDIDETFTFNNPVTAQVGLGAMRNQMAEKMGYGDFGGGAQRGGLGVKTGNDALDKALNRDYSQLVKRFNK
jgi:pantoate kinase